MNSHELKGRLSAICTASAALDERISACSQEITFLQADIAAARQAIMGALQTTKIGDGGRHAAEMVGLEGSQESQSPAAAMNGKPEAHALAEQTDAEGPSAQQAGISHQLAPKTILSSSKPSDMSEDPTAATKYIRADAMRELSLQRKDVALLRADTFALLLMQGKLTAMNRQELERQHPEAFADEELVERCFREVEVAATRTNCGYPGVVVLSYCWSTPQHPDPSGWLGKRIAMCLHFYAAQRARWTRTRLYNAKGRTRETVEEYAFDWNFVVFVDFWSLFQPPRSPDESRAFTRALQAMHVWYGHRGTMVWLARMEPGEGEQEGGVGARGGYDSRGWTTFERVVAALCKVGGMCLDLAGFQDMLALLGQGGARGKEHGPAQGEEPGGAWVNPERAAALTGGFVGASGEELRRLAMFDDGGLVKGASCLVPLVEGRQRPPVTPKQMARELAELSFSVEEDRAVCAGMYEAVVVELLGSMPQLNYEEMRHWGPAEMASVGSVLVFCRTLRLLNLINCKMSDRAFIAFADTLQPSSAPLLSEIILRGNAVSVVGLDALGRALSRGAMPMLREVWGNWTTIEGGIDAAAARLAAAARMRVGVGGGRNLKLLIER